MRYKLNESHNYRPKTALNRAAVQRVTEYLAGGRTASEQELRNVLAGVTNPHGDVVNWLARRSRRVIVAVHESAIGSSEHEDSMLRTSVQGPPPSPEGKERRGSNAANIWSNPKAVDLSSPLIYRIEIWSIDGEYYDYVGKARSGARLNEYDRNLVKIRLGKERGKNQSYRAVHLALYRAVQDGWKYHAYPLENCDFASLNSRERQLIEELPCSLNGGKRWRVVDLRSLSIADLLRG
jgi:hypothetical protein